MMRYLLPAGVAAALINVAAANGITVDNCGDPLVLRYRARADRGA